MALAASIQITDQDIYQQRVTTPASPGPRSPRPLPPSPPVRSRHASLTSTNVSPHLPPRHLCLARVPFLTVWTLITPT